MIYFNGASDQVLDHIIDALRRVSSAKKTAYQLWHNRQKLLSSIHN